MRGTEWKLDLAWIVYRAHKIYFDEPIQFSLDYLLFVVDSYKVNSAEHTEEFLYEKLDGN